MPTTLESTVAKTFVPESQRRERARSTPRHSIGGRAGVVVSSIFHTIPMFPTHSLHISGPIKRYHIGRCLWVENWAVFLLYKMAIMDE